MQAEESVKILFSARDPGAAAHIREIATQAVQRDDLEAVVLAAPPGLEILRDAGLAVRQFRAGPVKDAADPGARELLGEARARLEELRPDAIVVGTSGPERGVDEALIACAQTPHTYAIQDYPGWVVSGFGHAANTYFVLDEAAARLTALRHTGRVVVAGSAKHATYGRIDPDELRSTARNALDASGPVIGFYGQPAWFLAGYEGTLERFASAVAAVCADAAVHYRPHPKETEAQRTRALCVFREAGLAAQHDPWAEAETSLCAVDVAASCFSSCGTDQIHLQRRATRPLGTVLYLMFAPDLRRHHRRDTRVELPLPASEGLALIAEDPGAIEDALGRALDPATRRALWRKAKAVLPDPGCAPDVVLGTIFADVEGAPRTRAAATP